MCLEIFGKVQGVFFRKYTKSEAQKLDVTGWVQNTERQTVIGKAEGTSENISAFKTWLRTQG